VVVASIRLPLNLSSSLTFNGAFSSVCYTGDRHVGHTGLNSARAGLFRGQMAQWAWALLFACIADKIAERFGLAD